VRKNKNKNKNKNNNRSVTEQLVGKYTTKTLKKDQSRRNSKQTAFFDALNRHRNNTFRNISKNKNTRECTGCPHCPTAQFTSFFWKYIANHKKINTSQKHWKTTKSREKAGTRLFSLPQIAIYNFTQYHRSEKLNTTITE